MNYDPNIRNAIQIVRVKFQQWGYSGCVDIKCGGNCKGKPVLDFAAEIHEEGIVNNQCNFSFLRGDKEEWFSCLLTNMDGDTLKVVDKVECLEEYIVGLEIIDAKPA